MKPTVLTMTYPRSGAVVTLLYPNAAEARRELVRRSQLTGWQIRGTGQSGALVDADDKVRIEFTIALKEVAAK